MAKFLASDTIWLGFVTFDSPYSVLESWKLASWIVAFLCSGEAEPCAEKRGHELAR